jgi:signal transduction histidine kinase
MPLWLNAVFSNLRAVFASLAFRFMLRYVVGLSIAVFLVMITLYASNSYRFYAQNEKLIASELQRLVERFEHDGNLERVELSRDPTGTVSLHYLLVAADGRKVAGDIDEWPQDMLRSWWDLKQRTQFIGSPSPHPLIMGQSHELANGQRLLIARSYDEILLIERVISGFMVRSVFITIVLGLLGGLVMAARSVRSLGRINKSITRIISGNLSERIPVADSRGDYKLLAMHFNQLLDRIQSLMDGMRQVTDNVAHDLRTPLTRIRNHLASLQQTVEPPTRDTVHSLLHEADSLLATFNALLRIAQVESGQRRSEFRCVDLQVILADLVELYEPLAMEKQQSLVAQIPGTLHVVGDRDLLFQAFANLLDNAIKYTPPEGSIRLRSWLAEEGGAVVELADTGEGIPSADREKVFRRFYRVEASRGAQPGNGLGLSLVKAVVSLHRAHIALDDGAPGLVVRICLPPAPPVTRSVVNG